MRQYKKQINKTIVSSALQTLDNVVSGVDSLALGQTSITDVDVPTGSNIKGVLFFISITNPSTTSVEVGINFQYILSGQAATVDPLATGGSPQRNQVIKTWHLIIAQDSQWNMTKYVKIPKQFQRIKEGMLWRLSINSSASREQAWMAIYKVRL